MTRVLVTGAGGQLGRCLMDLLRLHEDFILTPTDLGELDITKPEEVNRLFEEHRFDYCVNCAAYTAVDRAETEKGIAEKINASGVENLARACLAFQCKMIHVSTDFIFDGKASSPYKEQDIPNPVNIYGATKLVGERAVQNILSDYFILRTSWVYSRYGNNFMKTMIKLGREREQLSVVSDQVGTPTYAGDLASLIVKIIAEDISAYGVYHYSNEGVASWYDFASEIFRELGIDCILQPVRTSQYPTDAARPPYSVLDKAKISEAFQITAPNWKVSLKRCLKEMRSGNDI